MSFEIIKLRQLTDEELNFLKLAQQIDRIPDRPSRRDALTRIGGGALAAGFPTLLVSNFAHAQTRELVRAIIQGGIKLSKELFFQQEPVEAQFDLVNETGSRQRKPVYNAIRSSALGITDQDYTYVYLAPGTATTVQHSGFRARTPGQNDYLAKTQIDEAKREFSVGE